MPRSSIGDALAALTERVMTLPGVVGTAQGRRRGKPCLLVFLSRRSAALLRRIPGRVQGYPVTIKKTGNLRALGD
jgi:hypothetical protein